MIYSVGETFLLAISLPQMTGIQEVASEDAVWGQMALAAGIPDS